MYLGCVLYRVAITIIQENKKSRDRVGEAGESSWPCLAPSGGSVFLVRERVGGAGGSPLPVRLCLAPSSGSLFLLRASD